MYEYGARLRRVIDGDTVVLDVDLGFTLWRDNDSYRLGRIDAPEMSTAAGPISKSALESYLSRPDATPKALMAQTQKADKYGRWLIELFADGVNVNDWLVTNGYAIYRTY